MCMVLFGAAQTHHKENIHTHVLDLYSIELWIIIFTLGMCHAELQEIHLHKMNTETYDNCDQIFLL